MSSIFLTDCHSQIEHLIFAFTLYRIPNYDKHIEHIEATVRGIPVIVINVTL